MAAVFVSATMWLLERAWNVASFRGRIGPSLPDARPAEPVSSTGTHGASSSHRHAWKSFTPRSYLAPSWRATLRPTRSSNRTTTKSDTTRGTANIRAKEKSTVYWSRLMGEEVARAELKSVFRSLLGVKLFLKIQEKRKILQNFLRLGKNNARRINRSREGTK